MKYLIVLLLSLIPDIIYSQYKGLDFSSIDERVSVIPVSDPHHLAVKLTAEYSKDIEKEYDILTKELKKYNPELLDKKRLLAISKADLLDEELLGEMKSELPGNIPAVFISALTNKGIDALKDMIWKSLNE